MSEYDRQKDIEAEGQRAALYHREAAKIPEAPVAVIDKQCGHSSCKGAGTYTMPGRCSNCGREYLVRCTKGHEAPTGYFGATCPNCGCSKVGCHYAAQVSGVSCPPEGK
jgi:DNA-directed RNA polymerase subunit RPC12/RpoP